MAASLAPSPSTPRARGATPVWPLLLALVVLAAALAVGMRMVMSRTDGRFVYALDDAYIHMAMAANLARHGVWGCTPFAFSAASSSPLWTVVLAAAFGLTGVRDSIPLILNGVFLALTLAVCDLELRRRQAGPALRVATLLTLVAGVPMPAMALLGMEHSLHLLLTLAFAVVALDGLAEPRSGRSDRRHGAALYLLAALLAASRYEGLFLVAVVGLLYLAAGRWRRTIALGAAAAAPMTLIGLVSVANGSFFLPNSLLLKAVDTTGSTWGTLLSPIGFADAALMLRHPGLAWLAGGGTLVATAMFARTRRIGEVAVTLPATLALAVLLHVHFTLSSEFWVYRYDAYLLGFGVFTAAVVAATLWPGRRGAGAGRADAGGAVAVLLCGAVSGTLVTGFVPRAEVESAALTYREHYTAAQFVQTHHAGETVLVNDVGAMAYLSSAHILDIFGLCDVEPVILRRAGHYSKEGVLAWTLRPGATLAVVQLSWGWVVDHVPETWHKVAEVELRPEHRVLGFFSTSEDAGDAARIRAEVTQFYAESPTRHGYHVRVF